MAFAIEGSACGSPAVGTHELVSNLAGRHSRANRKACGCAVSCCIGPGAPPTVGLQRCHPPATLGENRPMELLPPPTVVSVLLFYCDAKGA